MTPNNEAQDAIINDPEPSRMKPDPIVQPTSGNASTKNASAGRIKSISGGGPNLSSQSNRTGSPPPNNPYKGR